MMGRARTSGRAGWPANLYTCKDGFKYRNPVTRKDSWMGKDQAKAFAAARTLNGLLSPGNNLVSRVAGKSETITDAIGVFRTADMPGRNWAPKTAELYKSVIDRIDRKIGTRQMVGFTVRDCATFIREVTESPRSRQQFRLALTWIFACAVEEGWIESNPAMQTRKTSYKRQRERLTKDVYDAIWLQAPSWLQNAMDVSLLTLLRREDVVSIQFADVHDGALWAIPGKTENSTGARVKIALDGSLADVVARCRNDVLSPYLIHRLPEKARPRDQRAKKREHHTQVMPEQLSREFADAREAAGIVSDNPPTFHEIRSLGGAQLREAGWSVAEVQALMTHTSPSMTEHYLEGHEVPWTEVRTGIQLSPIGRK
ncbi:integrase [Rhodanobacter sp. B04]|nr:integrase [Rhodanobacter sp. B04]